MQQKVKGPWKKATVAHQTQWWKSGVPRWLTSSPRPCVNLVSFHLALCIF